MAGVALDQEDGFEEKKMWFEILKPWLNPMLFHEQQKEPSESELPQHRELRINVRYEEMVAKAKYEMRRMSEAKRGG